MDISLKDRVILITGASRGIGAGISRVCAESGAKISLASRNLDVLKSLSNSLSLSDENILVQSVDVSSEKQVEDCVKKTHEKFGRIDGLVNNAGITRDGLLIRMKESDWDDVLNINLKGVFLTTKHVSRYMLRQRAGKIVNITSVAGVIGNPGQANYSASKAGIIGFTLSTAREFASRHICVNAIAPGFINTDMTGVLSEEQKKAALAHIPLKKFGEAEDIAYSVCFLLSSLSDYITGQVIGIDGGMGMR